MKFKYKSYAWKITRYKCLAENVKVLQKPRLNILGVIFFFVRKVLHRGTFTNERRNHECTSRLWCTYILRRVRIYVNLYVTEVYLYFCTSSSYVLVRIAVHVQVHINKSILHVIYVVQVICTSCK